MSRSLGISLFCAVCIVAPASASAKQQTQRVKVKVVEVAGDLAYLEPGSDAGLASGTTVTIRRRTFKVVTVTAHNAVVRVGKHRLRIGHRGSARVSVSKDGVKRLAEPPSLDTFKGAWSAPSLPASEQTPKLIPIGVVRRGGPTEVRVSADAASWIPFSDTPADPVTRVSIRGQLRTEPFADTPFGFDADFAVARWFGVDNDLGDGSRPIFEVQELRARYGSYDAPMVGLGRLRYAALTVGLLDGVRVASPSFGGFSVAGFGGLVPDTLDGNISTDLARFGAEVSYLAPEHKWHPGGELVLYGSTFDGSVDERRASGAFRLYPGPVSLSGHAELSLFDSDNPWGASRVELTAAGLDANLRLGPVDLAASFDAQQPERSRWLASLLPASWLCTAAAEPAADPPAEEGCNGSRNLRYYGLARAGLRLRHIAVHAGGTTIHSSDGVDQLGGFVDLQALRLWKDLSVSVGGLFADSPVLDTWAVRLAAAMPVIDALDVDIFYRPAVLRYDAAIDDIFDPRAGVGAYYAKGTSLALRLSGETRLSDDVTAVGVFGAATWRMGF